MPQLLTEEDMRELDSLNSESGLYSPPTGTRFWKVSILFAAEKRFYVGRVCIQDKSFNNFENDANQTQSLQTYKPF